MAYERFEKQSVRVLDPTLSLAKSGKIALNAAAGRIMQEAGIKSVVILWDKTSYGIALQAAHKGDRNAYTLSFATDTGGATCAAKSFLSTLVGHPKNG